MSDDDDADCPAHVWKITTVMLGRGAYIESQCQACGAVRLEDPDTRRVTP